MRIAGGELRGRRLKVPKDGVRPTGERVREAIFSMLGERIVDARVLDLFAGSGALGIEAWSRGAASVTCVELNRKSCQLIKANIADLCGEGGEVRCIASDALHYARNARQESYDILFADPPYYEDWLVRLGPKLIEGGLFAEDAILVFEQHRSETIPEELNGLSCVRDKLYGTTRVLMYSNDA